MSLVQCPRRVERDHARAVDVRIELAVLLDALDGVALSARERASLTWLTGFGLARDTRR